MADTQVRNPFRSGRADGRETEQQLDALARKQRILDHLAESRRARESSNIDDKSAALQARIQRRLAARRHENATTPARLVDADRLAEADQKSGQAAGEASKNLPEIEKNADPSSAREWRDALAQLRTSEWDGLQFAAQSQSAAGRSTSGRILNFQTQASASSREIQSELTRLQSTAQTEKERADFVAALLEDVLGSATASLIKHQARLESMQAQINALQGR